MFDAAGKHLGGNDDEGTSFDSFMRFTAPAAGDYFVHIRDQLMGGGADYVYRVELTPVSPRLTVTTPEVARNDNQTRQWIAVPRGNRWTSFFQTTRADFGGPLQFEAADLPAGVTMSAPQVAANVGSIAVVFEAAADAPLGAKLVELRARHADANVKIAGRFEHNAVFVRGNPNDTPYYTTKVSRIAVAVVDERPSRCASSNPRCRCCRRGR